MTLWDALALGVVQGFTEFLPISSDGHLALAHLVIEAHSGLPAQPGTGEADLVFDVFAHLGTMLAIAVVLRQRILALLRALLPLGPSPAPGAAALHALDRRWIWLIVAASVPTGIVGLALKHTTEWMRLEPIWLGVWFLATASLLVAGERVGARRRGAGELDTVDALLMGAAQGLAVLPGLSRSGTTIATGLWRDLEPAVVVDFSLLMSIPAVFGANLLELPKLQGMEPLPLFVGFASSLVTGMAAVKLLQWIVVRRRLLPFAAYVGLLGVGTLLYGIFHG